MVVSDFENRWGVVKNIFRTKCQNMSCGATGPEGYSITDAINKYNKLREDNGNNIQHGIE